MADPTLAEIKDQWDKVIQILEDWRAYVGVTTGANYVDREDALLQSLETNYLGDWHSGLGTFRGLLDAAGQAASLLLTPVVREYGRFIKAPETDPRAILSRIYRYFIDQSITIKSRGFAFGGVVAGAGNVGTGTVHRLTVDADGVTIENTTADKKTIKCVADARSGANEHEEVFEIVGEARNPDNLVLRGSGKLGSLRNMSALSSLSFLVNPSFDDTLSTTAIPGWEIGGSSTISNFTLDTTNYYRGYFGQTTPASLQWAGASGTLTQALSANNTQIDPSVPMYLQVAFNASLGSAVGTLTLHLGSQSTAVTVTGLSGWQVLTLDVGVKNWFKVWNEANPAVKLTWARTSGTIYIDDIIFCPFQPFDGLWYAPVGGATRAQLNDSFTFADAETGSKRQYWNWRAFGMYLPHSATPNWSDPA